MNFQFKRFSSLARFLTWGHTSYLFPNPYPPLHPYPHPHPALYRNLPAPLPKLLSKQFYLSKNDKQMLIEI